MQKGITILIAVSIVLSSLLAIQVVHDGGLVIGQPAYQTTQAAQQSNGTGNVTISTGNTTASATLDAQSVTTFVGKP